MGTTSDQTVPAGDHKPSPPLGPPIIPHASAEEMVPVVWQPGDVILDLYEVTHVHGGGGMGLVYRVRHRGWGIDLAVKSPRPRYFRNPVAAANFEREARTWVELGLHPHTVSCYYVRRLGGVPRLFAEYVAGGTLSEWIHGGRLYAGGPEPALRRILDIAIQMAWGLHHAHAHGLVHQDVKPANVLLTSAGIAKVTDFGLAKARGAAHEPASARSKHSVLMSFGGMTPAYCSPEQAERRPLSRKTDLWSWAVAVLEMFVADVTWPAGQVAAAALASYRARPPEDERLPRMPPALADLLGRCFQDDPDARPADMLVMATELQEIYRQATNGRYPRRAPKAAEAQAGTLNNRAVSLLDLGQPAAAEELWRKALELDPQHVEAIYNRELRRYRAGRQSHAVLLQKLRAIARSHPREWLPAYLLARGCLEGGDCLAAIQTLGRITGSDAERDEVRATLALAKNRLAETQECTRTFTGHTGPVHSVALRGDGRWALSGSQDGTLRLWDVAAGRCLRTLRGHADDVLAVGLSRDGRLAVSAGVDGTIKTWDVAAGQVRLTLTGHAGAVRALSLGADGQLVLSGGDDGTVRLWNTATGQRLRTFPGHVGPVRAVCLSPDGRRALSGGDDRTVRLWDVDTARTVRVLEGHTAWVAAVCFRGDGTRALSGGDVTARLWDVDTGQCLQTLAGHGGIVRAVCFRGDQAVTASVDHMVRLWDLSAGRCLVTCEGHGHWVQSVCVHPNGYYALSGSADGTLKLWRLDWETRAPVAVCRVLSSETALAALTVYERRLAQARRALIEDDAVTAARCLRAARAQPGYESSPEVLRTWRQLSLKLPRATLRTGWEGQTLTGHKDAVTDVSVSRDGRFALSSGKDRTLRLWDLRAGTCTRVLKGHGQPVLCACLSPDGRRALSGGTDQTVRLWDLAGDDDPLVLEGHTGAVRALAWGSGGDCAISASDDGALILWDLVRGRCLREFAGHKAAVHAVALSPDDRFAVSGSEDRTLRLWDTADGECLVKIAGNAAQFTSVCFSGSGQHVLTGDSSFDGLGQIKLWDVGRRRCLRKVESNVPGVRSVHLSLDGRFALSGGYEPTVKLWSLADGRCLHTFEGHTAPVNAVRFSRDGQFALSGGDDGTLRTWVLDWELENRQPAAWDSGARPFLETFLTLHTPRPARRFAFFNPLGGSARAGPPTWSGQDFDELMQMLGCAGYGWLTGAGVRRKLEQMARHWQGPPAVR